MGLVISSQHNHGQVCSEEFVWPWCWSGVGCHASLEHRASGSGARRPHTAVLHSLQACERSPALDSFAHSSQRSAAPDGRGGCSHYDQETEERERITQGGCDLGTGGPAEDAAGMEDCLGSE